MDKKHISVLLAVLIFSISTGTFAFENRHKIELVVGEKNIAIEDKTTIIESEPIEKDGKIYIDINTLKYLKGIDVSYDQATKKVSISQERPRIFFNGAEKKDLINLIRKSKIIFVEMYLLTDNEIIEELHKKAYTEKDVMIRIILNKDLKNKSFKKGANTERYIENMLKNKDNREISLINWINGRIESNYYLKSMHRKLAIFDSKTIFIGSTNWTETAFNENWEVGLIYNDKDEANKLSNLFLEHWKSCKGVW